MQVHSALIHEFDIKAPPRFDDDGDQMVGFYYQFIDVNEKPVYGLIGPYQRRVEAEHAAQRAFEQHDF